MFITSIIILLPIIGYLLGYRYANKEYDKALLHRRVRRGWQKNG